MSARKGTRKAPTGVWVENYFDATFTAKEREALRDKLMRVCGYEGSFGCLAFNRDIEGPAENDVWQVFVAQGLDRRRDYERLADYTLIHICRELQVEYKSFAANKPKLPIDGFVQAAKRSFPDFRRPRNAIEAKIQEHKLNSLWCDWRVEECVRTGCTCDSHWLCSDRFVSVDFVSVALSVFKHNETRPKLYVV